MTETAENLLRDYWRKQKEEKLLSCVLVQKTFVWNFTYNTMFLCGILRQKPIFSQIVVDTN